MDRGSRAKPPLTKPVWGRGHPSADGLGLFPSLTYSTLCSSQLIHFSHLKEQKTSSPGLLTKTPALGVYFHIHFHSQQQPCAHGVATAAVLHCSESARESTDFNIQNPPSYRNKEVGLQLASPYPGSKATGRTSPASPRVRPDGRKRLQTLWLEVTIQRPNTLLTIKTMLMGISLSRIVFLKRITNPFR